MNKAFRFISSIACLISIHLTQAQSTTAYLDEKKQYEFFYPDSLEIINRIKPAPNKYDEYLRIARLLQSNGKFDAAIHWYQKTLSLPYVSEERKASTYSYLSTILGKTGNYNAAIEAYLKATKSSNKEIINAKVKINASSLYIALLDYDEAFKIINESLTIFKKNKDRLWIALALDLKSTIYKSRKQYHKAIATMQEALIYLADQKKQNKQDVMVLRNILLNNIADAYLQLKMPDSVLHYLEKIKPEFDLLSQYVQAGIYITYGEASLLLYQNALAVEYFQKGIEIAEKSNMQDVKKAAYKGLSMVYHQQRDYQKAWEYEHKYVELYTKQLSEDSRNKISQLQTRYALEKKDKEIARKELLHNKEQLQQQQRNNRLYMLIAVIGLSAIIIAIFFRNQYNKNRYLKVELQNSENKNLIANIEATLHGEENERERIAQELHDSVVSELLSLQLNLKDIEHHHPELQQSEAYSNVLYQTEETADKLRRATHNMMPAKLKEEGLVKTMEAFINRISSHKLQISFLCYGHKVKLKDSTEKILLSTAQELIQNVMKHAKASEALVQLNYYEDTLGLTVEDDGVGIGKAHKDNVTGMGWNNIRRNVAAINGSLDVQSSEEEGTTVLIEIPTTQRIV